MKRSATKAKLHEDWIPQMDTKTGIDYFVNIRTGVSQRDHPNILFQLLEFYYIACVTVLTIRLPNTMFFTRLFDSAVECFCCYI